ncbi:MAG: SDR family NAD(P)-dependent oxidoreductase [Deltaproteobacteria bacterium]|nr:SDR family NAD(P)-dependent oxidoreductase [Deltaproteobacteria bacterium]
MKYDMVDRRCIVTGASSGIGKEIARNLAYFGASVVLACRDRDRGSATLHEIVTDSGNENVTMMQVDLGHRQSIRAFVKNVTAGGPVHVLVNNAAVLCADRRVSPDGIEQTWATNVLGYFALTNLLLPTLRRSGPARVVNVASTFARGLQLDDVQFERRKYSGMAAYAASKQADRMLAWRLAELTVNDDVSVHACHPGAVGSGLFREQSGWFGRLIRMGQGWALKSPNAGALTPTFVAADPTVAAESGRFWIDRAPRPCPFARDRAALLELWRICVEQTQCDA